MAATAYFTSATFAFLRDLAKNNNRPWFEKNKHRYEADVKEPALRFIEDFGPKLDKISRHFRADPRPVGGSLFRISRDVRFSKDKSPYKTALGIHFRHERAKDVHAPGFYLHIQPKETFLGAGIWRPDGKTLGTIREAIAEDPAAWKKAVTGRALKARFELDGESLTRPPKGFDPEHPAIEDLKRKDFVAMTRVDDGVVTGARFLQDVAGLCKDASPLNRFLCEAVGVPY